MRVRIQSNFHVPGLEGESIAVEDGSTVRQLLENISKLSEGTLIFFEFGRDTLDPDDWEVDVNGILFDGHQIGADTLLKDNDAVEIRLMMYCG